MTRGAAFWDRVARRYAEMQMRNPETYEHTLDLVREHLRPGDRVLELGCGTGTTALRLADAVERYVASDYSAEMITIAGERRSKAGVENLDLCVGQPCDGSLPEGPFDAILAFNLLHLLPNRRQAFADVAQHLRPGGLFISKTPCLGGVYRVFQPLVSALRLLGKAPDFNFLTPARLEREIRMAGFDIIAAGDYPKRPPRRFIVARKG
ncbi:class I SAM-dependent methyltransferase [Rhodobacteraceae bacterium N5(2021)]|uniref:Class I SAM-dependent methyltransferase n=1 Tax=Gymnodinialimonas phycosphaerae TaxID=2841589 RepID=A0A975YHT1_9RHOB|nr:class I SAM-dependent methyltransferase [Gymnodinialimonas phycosphaerae]MBY4893007.1 class I SAM-dependent methyltransferase [Gymnodinialimonas phycosphaerae]